MRWYERWERRLRPFAIPYLTNVLVAFQVVVYLAVLFTDAREAIFEQFGLIPEQVFAGEVWRLLTFPIMPPQVAPIWAFFYFYLFYLMGNALEVRWGSVAFNAFLGIGLLATASSGLIGAAVYPGQFPADEPLSNAFVNSTIFLGFAYLFPDFTLMLFFILPIKIKWLAYLQWATMAFMFIVAPNWVVRISILASVLNFFVFFGPDIYQRAMASKRRMERTASKLALANRASHTCTICGITNLTHPDEEFRYCSKCDGSPAYCSAHLHNHEHVAAEKV